MKPEANATICTECGVIFEDKANVNVKCPNCDDYLLRPVRIEPCRTKHSKCGSEFHHHGRGDHVIEVDD